MYHPTVRIAHTTVFVTPVVEHWLEREIAQWVHEATSRSGKVKDYYCKEFKQLLNQNKLTEFECKKLLILMLNMPF